MRRILLGALLLTAISIQGQKRDSLLTPYAVAQMCPQYVVPDEQIGDVSRKLTGCSVQVVPLASGYSLVYGVQVVYPVVQQ